MRTLFVAPTGFNVVRIGRQCSFWQRVNSSELIGSFPWICSRSILTFGYFFNFNYDECSSAGPNSYLLEMISCIYFLGRSSFWWNITRWGFSSWTVPDYQWGPFPRWEPNPRRLGPLPHSLHLTWAGQYDCSESWGTAQGGRPTEWTYLLYS